MLKEFLEELHNKQDMKKEIYHYVHSHGSVSKIDLFEKFDIPQTTLTRIIDFLEGKDLIYNAGLGLTSGGRPPILYRATPNAGYYFGVELSRTHVNVMLLDATFNILSEEDFLLEESHTAKVTVDKIIAIVSALKNKYVGKSKMVVGIGIGAVGPLDRKSGIILNPEGFNSEGWNDFPIVDMIHKHFSIPVYLSNGVDAAGLAEYHHGSYQEISILYCISGYGIRCSYLDNGVLLNRHPGDATSYGHMIIEKDGNECECGKRGCLVSYTSIGAIIKKANALTGIEIKDAQGLIDLVNSGKSPAVNDLVLGSAEYYGLGLSNMVNALHPDIIMLHGKLIYQYEPYFETVKRVLEANIYPLDSHVVVKKGSLGEKATAMGVAIDVFHKVI